MKAIIIHTTGSKPGQEDLSNQILTSGMTDLHMENLMKSGISHVFILGQKEKLKKDENLRKNNMEIIISEYFRADLFDNSDEDILVLESKSISTINIDRFYQNHKGMNSNFSVSVSDKSNEDFFSPIIVKSKILRTFPDYNGKFQPNLFKVFLKNLKPENTIKDNYQSFTINSYEQYWEFHKAMLEDDLIDFTTPGIPILDNLWININSHVQKSVSNTGHTIIGKNTIVHGDVKLKGFVVIGNNVIIDKGAIIEDSIIMNNTYIGLGIHVKKSVVNKNYLYNIIRSKGLTIDDEKIIDELNV